jgi:large subunit ribosomal protein L23
MPIFDVFKKKEKEKKAPKQVAVKKVKEKEAKRKKEKVKPKKKAAKVDSGAFRTLVKPLISEKATFLGSENKYVFEVSQKSNKKEIRQAIEGVYGVKPVRIHIVNVKGKEKKYGRTVGRTKDRKKAIITLREGESIQVYEGV